MIIHSLRFAGFRGARKEVSIEFPAGFAVVVGRNGSGKSTVCDAIEFALTGQLRGSTSHTEKREGIEDYIWWRGEQPPTERFVELILRDSEGRLHLVRRTPVDCEGVEELERMMCDGRSIGEHPLARLCRTSIIRDEEITRLSIDLKETERFDFVRSILGTADFSDTEDNARLVLNLLKEESVRAEKEYSSISSTVADLTTRLSTARSEMVKEADIATAESQLRHFLKSTERDPERLAALSEKSLAELRVRTDRLTRIYTGLEAFQRLKAQSESIDSRQRINEYETEIKKTQALIAELESQSARTRDALAEAERESPKNASLASLREHGQRLGLLNGSCPLCGTKQSAKDFREHLNLIHATLTESHAALEELTKQAAEQSTQLSALRSQQRSSQAHLADQMKVFDELEGERLRLAAELNTLGFEKVTSSELPDTSSLALAIEQEREQAIAIENAIARLQSSRVSEEVSKLERDLKGARDEQTTSEARLSRVRTAAGKAKEAFDTVRRARGEVINERLAELEPLLLELYQRLRPHVDWPEVRYRLRGDVRKMLSFEVGDGLNPNFVFSSGQRRAAGLAFLLALHLSRTWCRFETLVLDDPVQHIDDYRALHLTEVLAAVRQSGRQIVCAVEDEALGKLLARRLRSNSEAAGVLIRMRYASDNGIHVRSREPITPFPRNVLIPA